MSAMFVTDSSYYKSCIGLTFLKIIHTFKKTLHIHSLFTFNTHKITPQQFKLPHHDWGIPSKVDMIKIFDKIKKIGYLRQL